MTGQLLRPAAGYIRHEQLEVFYVPSLPRHGPRMSEDVLTLTLEGPQAVRVRGESNPDLSIYSLPLSHGLPVELKALSHDASNL